METIGKMVEIRRYPVKSMAGEVLEEATIAKHGLEGDRVYYFVNTGELAGRWFTARQLYKMVLFKPRFTGKSDDFSDITVETPEGRSYRIDSPELAKELSEGAGKEVKLEYSRTGMPDAYPISIFSAQTVAELERELGIAIDRRRFRANLYVDWSSKMPFYEEGLVGREIMVGKSVRLKVTEKDKRCVIIGVDPGDGRYEAGVLKDIVEKHGKCAGIYASVAQGGKINAGDPIMLLP